MNNYKIYSAALSTMRNTWLNISPTKFNKQFCNNKARVSSWIFI